MQHIATYYACNVLQPFYNATSGQVSAPSMSEPAFLKRVLILSFQVEHNGNGLMKNNGNGLMKNNSRFCQNAKFWKSQEIPGRHMSLYKVLLVEAILIHSGLSTCFRLLAILRIFRGPGWSDQVSPLKGFLGRRPLSKKTRHVPQPPTPCCPSLPS